MLHDSDLHDDIFSEFNDDGKLGSVSFLFKNF